LIVRLYFYQIIALIISLAVVMHESFNLFVSVEVLISDS